MNKTITNIDWIVVSIILALTIFGCINIYSVDIETMSNTTNFTKQCLWAGIAISICFMLNLVDTKFYTFIPIPLYAITIVLLIITVVMGKSIAGHNAWLQLAGLRIQPAEFTKFTTALLIAHIISNTNTHFPSIGRKFCLISTVLLPIGIILLQGDVGSGLVFISYALVFFREEYFVMPIIVGAYIGIFAIIALIIPQNYLSIGILCVSMLIMSFFINNIKKIITIIVATLTTLSITYGTHTLVNQLLKPHQKNRIEAWISPDSDPRGIGWNVNQSKIAIGSGGFLGKGLFNGTQTKYGFVPEQHTDFIFCTIGEEHGWIGCSIVIILFIVLICRLIHIAERQRLQFARVYGYAIASILLFHFTINIGMTIGLMPVIGIPLPFMSYGGSSLLTFFVMTFILLKFDAERIEYAAKTTIHP